MKLRYWIYRLRAKFILLQPGIDPLEERAAPGEPDPITRAMETDRQGAGRPLWLYLIGAWLLLTIAWFACRGTALAAPEPTATPTATATATLTPTATPTPSPSPSPTATATPTNALAPLLTATAARWSPTPSPSPAATATPQPPQVRYVEVTRVVVQQVQVVVTRVVVQTRVVVITATPQNTIAPTATPTKTPSLTPTEPPGTPPGANRIFLPIILLKNAPGAILTPTPNPYP